MKLTLITALFLLSSASAFANHSRTYSCTTVNPSYPSLESDLQVLTYGPQGSVSSSKVFTFHLKSDCNAVAGRLNQHCGYGGSCSLLFCEAQSSQYQSLETTLHQARTLPDGGFSVSAVQQFAYKTECLQAIR